MSLSQSGLIPNQHTQCARLFCRRCRMDDMESQRDEADVLSSIYSDDPNFTQVNATTFQYKLGPDGNAKSFLLQVSWPGDYPSTSAPDITLDLFYNKHLAPDVKCAILDALKEESQNSLGMASTFTLFEYCKEHVDALTAHQPELSRASTCAADGRDAAASGNGGGAQMDKENAQANPMAGLSKSAKRKMWDRAGAGGERIRGHDWVDVIKHLSQTGGQRT